MPKNANVICEGSLTKSQQVVVNHSQLLASISPILEPKPLGMISKYHITITYNDVISLLTMQVSFSFKKCSSSTTLSVDGKLKLKPKHDVKNDVIFEEDDEEWDPDDDDSSNDSSDDPNDYTYTSDDSDLGEFENSD